MTDRAFIHEAQDLGGRLADGVTAFVGSWTFIGLHVVWFTTWISSGIEPYPFGLLTMIVSLEAIILSTLVMLSQNRQATRDRTRDDLEAREVDSLFRLSNELNQINRTQLEILKELRERK